MTTPKLCGTSLPSSMVSTVAPTTAPMNITVWGREEEEEEEEEEERLYEGPKGVRKHTPRLGLGGDQV